MAFALDRVQRRTGRLLSGTCTLRLTSLCGACWSDTVQRSTSSTLTRGTSCRRRATGPSRSGARRRASSSGHSTGTSAASPACSIATNWSSPAVPTTPSGLSPLLRFSVVGKKIVGSRSWSRCLAVSLQLTWVINPAVGCHYFPPGPQLLSQPLRGCYQFRCLVNRGTMVVNSLPKTSRLHRSCDLNPGPSAPESSMLFLVSYWICVYPFRPAGLHIISVNQSDNFYSSLQ